MKREAYIHASTRVRSLEKQLMPNTALDNLASASDFVTALQLFNESSYAAALSRAPRGDDYEFALTQTRDKLYRDLQDIAPESPVNEFLALPYIYHNGKVLLKAHFLQQDMEDLAVEAGGVELVYLAKIIESPEQNPRSTPFEVALAEAVEDFQKNRDPKRSDAILDRACATEMAEVVKEAKIPTMTNYFKERMDFINVGTFFRAVRRDVTSTEFEYFLVPGGHIDPQRLLQLYRLYNEKSETFISGLDEAGATSRLKEAASAYLDGGDLAAFEKARDDAGIATAMAGARVTYGPEVIFAYAIRRETEIQNLRIILMAAKNNIDTSSVRERLRDING